MLGNVHVLVHTPDIHVHQHEVGVQQGLVGRVVKVGIEDVAVRAPIAAKIQNDAFVGALRGL